MNAAHASCSLRLATWNLKVFGGRSTASAALGDAKLDLVRDLVTQQQPLVLALQEVTPGYAESLAQFGALHHSLSLRRPGRFDGGNRYMGVVLLTAGDVRVRNVAVVERAPFPERTLAGDIEIAGRVVHMLAFHSLTGVGYRTTKQAQFRAIAEYLADREGDVVFLGDANEPMIDARDAAPRRAAGGAAGHLLPILSRDRPSNAAYPPV